MEIEMEQAEGDPIKDDNLPEASEKKVDECLGDSDDEQLNSYNYYRINRGTTAFARWDHTQKPNFVSLRRLVGVEEIAIEEKEIPTAGDPLLSDHEEPETNPVLPAPSVRTDRIDPFQSIINSLESRLACTGFIAHPDTIRLRKGNKGPAKSIVRDLYDIGDEFLADSDINERLQYCSSDGSTSSQETGDDLQLTQREWSDSGDSDLGEFFQAVLQSDDEEGYLKIAQKEKSSSSSKKYVSLYSKFPLLDISSPLHSSPRHLHSPPFLSSPLLSSALFPRRSDFLCRNGESSSEGKSKKKKEANRLWKTEFDIEMEKKDELYSLLSGRKNNWIAYFEDIQDRFVAKGAKGNARVDLIKKSLRSLWENLFATLETGGSDDEEEEVTFSPSPFSGEALMKLVNDFPSSFDEMVVKCVGQLSPFVETSVLRDWWRAEGCVGVIRELFHQSQTYVDSLSEKLTGERGKEVAIYVENLMNEYLGQKKSVRAAKKVEEAPEAPLPSTETTLLAPEAPPPPPSSPPPPTTTEESIKEKKPKSIHHLAKEGASKLEYISEELHNIELYFKKQKQVSTILRGVSPNRWRAAANEFQINLHPVAFVAHALLNALREHDHYTNPSLPPITGAIIMEDLKHSRMFLQRAEKSIKKEEAQRVKNEEKNQSKRKKMAGEGNASLEGGDRETATQSTKKNKKQNPNWQPVPLLTLPGQSLIVDELGCVHTEEMAYGTPSAPKKSGKKRARNSANLEENANGGGNASSRKQEERPSKEGKGSKKIKSEPNTRSDSPIIIEDTTPLEGAPVVRRSTRRNKVKEEPLGEIPRSPIKQVEEREFEEDKKRGSIRAQQTPPPAAGTHRSPIQRAHPHLPSTSSYPAPNPLSPAHPSSSHSPAPMTERSNYYPPSPSPNSSIFPTDIPYLFNSPLVAPPPFIPAPSPNQHRPSLTPNTPTNGTSASHNTSLPPLPPFAFGSIPPPNFNFPPPPNSRASLFPHLLPNNMAPGNSFPLFLPRPNTDRFNTITPAPGVIPGVPPPVAPNLSNARFQNFMMSPPGHIHLPEGRSPSGSPNPNALDAIRFANEIISANAVGNLVSQNIERLRPPQPERQVSHSERQRSSIPSMATSEKHLQQRRSEGVDNGARKGGDNGSNKKNNNKNKGKNNGNASNQVTERSNASYTAYKANPGVMLPNASSHFYTSLREEGSGEHVGIFQKVSELTSTLFPARVQESSAAPNKPSEKQES